MTQWLLCNIIFMYWYWKKRQETWHHHHHRYQVLIIRYSVYITILNKVQSANLIDHLLHSKYLNTWKAMWKHLFLNTNEYYVISFLYTFNFLNTYLFIYSFVYVGGAIHTIHTCVLPGMYGNEKKNPELHTSLFLPFESLKLHSVQ